ncbi:hypothetical protein ACH4U6_17355 [Streptomyces netropsis]|uniref:hypothetical protein n=1 Tax=Streptomyces netropsis TaxID=55404 RepID=UPI003798F2E9
MLTVYAAHSQPNRRPSGLLSTLPGAPLDVSLNNFALTSEIKAGSAAAGQQRLCRRDTTARCARGPVGVDLDAVRAFVAVADASRFQQAAADLHVPQPPYRN